MLTNIQRVIKIKRLDYFFLFLLFNPSKDKINSFKNNGNKNKKM